MKDTISKTLNLAPIKKDNPVEVIVPNDDNEAIDDFKFTRENLYSLINNGQDALEEMISVAKASEHPRAYEVVSTLMRTVVDANKDLLDLSKKKKELLARPEDEKRQVNNNLFVGSTADLQKMLEDREK